MAGYSGTPLAKKLGIKPSSRVALHHAPPGAEALLDPLPEGVTFVESAALGVDVALLFVSWLADLARDFPEVAQTLQPAGGLWVAWPKKAAKLPGDLDENAIRELGLREGLVDNKVCAIDDTWSGLRFVYRLKDRPNAAR